VGSMLVQLAHELTGMTVIGTASRPETADWVKRMGADHVIDHRQPMLAQLQVLGIGEVSYVASLTHTEEHLAQLIEVLRPQGRLGVIDDPRSLDVMPLKLKSLSLHWELMFTRSLFETPDMINQHHLLNRIAQLIDQGILQTTLGEHFGVINAANMRRAHALVESNKARGKIVLEGFA
jgi:zinc-binding alcohol dehydrogenase family protein